MGDMKNPFESLRIPGIVGTVATSYTTVTVYSNGAKECVQILVEELEPGKWAFGYLIYENGKRIRSIPGEGEGYFLSRDDAILYGLGELGRLQYKAAANAKGDIERMIRDMTQFSLFD